MNKIYLIAAFVLVSSMIACNTNKKNQPEAEEKATIETAAYDSTKIQIDAAMIDSMTIIFTDTDIKEFISKEDQAKLSESLLTAQYDTAWNDKGLMVKMVAPDYTLIFQYKDKSADENDWLMIWKENGRTKYKDKWFLLADNKNESIYQLLEGYRKPEKKN